MSVASGVTVGFLTPPRWTWPELSREWQRLDAAGVQHLWVIDHIARRSDRDRRYEAWTQLAALAALTDRARVGVLATPWPLRPPALVALATATIDAITGGRMEIGVGAGALVEDRAIIGVPERDSPERRARFEEWVCALDSLLRGEDQAFAGEFYRTDGKSPAPPVQHPRPPLTIATNSRKTLALVAKHADRWVSFGGLVEDAEGRAALEDGARWTEWMNRRLDELCAVAGRDPRSIKRAVRVLRPPVDAYGSREGLLEYVGRYVEAGTDEFFFTLVDPSDKRRPGLDRIVAEYCAE